MRFDFEQRRMERTVFGESKRSRPRPSKFVSEADVDVMAESKLRTFA